MHGDKHILSWRWHLGYCCYICRSTVILFRWADRFRIAAQNRLSQFIDTKLATSVIFGTALCSLIVAHSSEGIEKCQWWSLNAAVAAAFDVSQHRLLCPQKQREGDIDYRLWVVPSRQNRSFSFSFIIFTTTIITTTRSMQFHELDWPGWTG